MNSKAPTAHRAATKHGKKAAQFFSPHSSLFLKEARDVNQIFSKNEILFDFKAQSRQKTPLAVSGSR